MEYLAPPLGTLVTSQPFKSNHQSPQELYTDSDGSIEHTITIIQNHNHILMREWEKTYLIKHVDNPDEPFWRDIKGHHLIILPDQGLKHKLMNVWHRDPSMATLDEMKPFDVSTRSISGPVPRHGSQNTSKAV
jgi:hypothetical protein